jgi:hypothetical protein
MCLIKLAEAKRPFRERSAPYFSAAARRSSYQELADLLSVIRGLAEIVVKGTGCSGMEAERAFP